MPDSRFGRRWSRIFKLDARSEVEDELAFHLEQRVRDNVARGMDPDAARAAAQQRLGDLKAIRSECTDLLVAERRTEKRREWARLSWLDFKLGFRMLVKYPGLTIVGGIAIAFAIMVGAASFEFMIKVARPALGLPDADRIVALRLWDASESDLEERVLHDFMTWRTQVRSVQDIGVYRTVERNLIGSDRRAVPVTSAEMSAAGFRVAGVAPLLGRPLLEQDERPGAPPVVVIGETLWRTRFDSDPAIIGHVVPLGGDYHTVVGVMPENFAFPLYHSAWTPFRVTGGYLHREGPQVSIFGRLAEGSTLEQAQAELTGLGARAAVESPRTHRHLQPQVVSYAFSFFDAEPIMVSYFLNSFMALFMLLLYANVALLMFGRAATRESEIVVRNALGASRGRILTQLFSEALVLGAVGAAIGLFVTRMGVGWAFTFLEGNNVDLPFWYRQELSPLTVVYAVGLTFVAALIAGVVPGLKATRGLGTQLRATSAGGGGLRFGGLWTVIIVAQVAFTVAFFPALIALGVNTVKARAVDFGVPAEQYLALRLERGAAELEASGDRRNPAAIVHELKRRVTAEAGVRGATYAQQVPGQYHPEGAIEVEGVRTLLPSGVQLAAQRTTVDLDFFDVMGARILLGRDFHSADVGSAAGVVVVNELFQRVVLGGANPVGRRMRYLNRDERDVSNPGPWYEIVGVVEDLAMWVAPDAADLPGVYHPLALDGAGSVGMVIHVEGEPLSFAGRLREIATDVDPTLRLQRMRPLDRIARDYLDAVTFWFRILLAAGSLALLLSLAGIYSIMSFTVARRTREIGIRVALGSSRGRVLRALFSRAFFQIGLGVAVGVGLVILFTADRVTAAGWVQLAKNLALVTAYAIVMSGVCLLACLIPARRALRIQPTDALRADG